MSWAKAREEAQRLVDRMQLKNSEISGKRIEIGPIMEKCSQEEGPFRVMISQGVERILRSRGAIVDHVKRA